MKSSRLPTGPASESSLATGLPPAGAGRRNDPSRRRADDDGAPDIASAIAVENVSTTELAAATAEPWLLAQAPGASRSDAGGAPAARPASAGGATDGSSWWAYAGGGLLGGGVIGYSLKDDDEAPAPTVAEPPPPLSGAVFDGPIAAARVFRDSNGNGQWDAGETYVLTGADGKFAALAGEGPALAAPYRVGGENRSLDISSGLEFAQVYRAPAGASVLNPLTTLVAALIDLDPALTPASAEARLKATLGLPESVSLLDYNPFAANPGVAALPVYRMAAEIANLFDVAIGALVAAKASAGVEDAAGSAIAVLARSLYDAGGANVGVALADADALRNYLVAVATREGAQYPGNPTVAAGVTRIGEQAGDVGQALANVNGAIRGATAADEVTGLRVVAQSILGDWLESTLRDGGRIDASALDVDTVRALAGGAAALLLPAPGAAAADAPTALVALSASSLRAGETATLTVTFSEPVLGPLGAAQFSAVGGAVGPLASVDGVNWQGVFTPTPGYEGVAALRLTGEYKTAAQVLGRPGELLWLMVDAQAPAAPAVALANDADGDRVTRDGTLRLGDLEAGAVVSYSSNGAASWSDRFTAVEGQNAVLVRQADAAGNVSPATSLSFRLDSQASAPAVALTNDTGIAGDRLSTDGRLSLRGVESGARVEYSTDDGLTWAAGFTAHEGANAVLARQTDVAGNVSAAASLQFVLDASGPAAPLIDVVAGDDLVTLGESVVLTGRAEAGSTVDLSFGGLSRTLTADTAGAWRYVLSGAEVTALAEGAGTVGAQARDAAGNAGVAASRAVVVDRLAPTVSIVLPDATLTEGERTLVGFVFSEPVGGFAADDVVVANGIKGGLTGGLGNYYLVVTPTADTSGVLTVDVPGAVAFDGALNGNLPGTQARRTFDTTTPDGEAPRISVATSFAGTATGAVVFSFSFSEWVEGFGVDDIDVVGGTADGFVALGPTFYSLAVTPPGNAGGVLTVNVPAGAATDVVGNGSAAMSYSLPFDTVSPVLAISDDTSGIAAGRVVFTFTFSEAVSGFNSSDISVTGGGKAGFAALSASTYTLAVTPDTNSTGSIVVAVSPNAAFDGDGDGNAALVQATQDYNTRAPTLTITDNVAGIATGDIVFTFTFSDAVSGFTAADVVVANGSKGAFAGAGAVYTLTVTPTPEASGYATVEVGAGAATDAAGNASLAAPVVSQEFNTTNSFVAGESVIDLGAYGKLIAPTFVDGHWYYHWDRSGDGTSADSGPLNGGVDYVSHDVLDALFTEDVDGLPGSGETSEATRYATLNGVRVALPTIGDGDSAVGYRSGSGVDNAPVGENNLSYDDLLAVWDAHNGNATATDTNGTPAGWMASHYWSATPTAGGHAYLYLVGGYVEDGLDFGNSYVALRVG